MFLNLRLDLASRPCIGYFPLSLIVAEPGALVQVLQPAVNHDPENGGTVHIPLTFEVDDRILTVTVREAGNSRHHVFEMLQDTATIAGEYLLGREKVNVIGEDELTARVEYGVGQICTSRRVMKVLFEAQVGFSHEFLLSLWGLILPLCLLYHFNKYLPSLQG